MEICRESDLWKLPRPSRERIRPRRGIVHLGPNRFFRAIEADFTEDAIREKGGAWGIVGVTRSCIKTAKQLKEQGCAYTAFMNAEDWARHRVQQSLVDILCIEQSSAPALRAIADPAIRIVSLSLGMGKYLHIPTTGELDLEHPETIQDLENPRQPRSGPGIVVEALRQRWVGGQKPFTVMSYDSFERNGDVARKVVIEMARASDPDLANWIAACVPFPSSVSSRLVAPANCGDLRALAQQSGLVDPTAVRHEIFRQWVIEDKFVNGRRPAWDKVGAVFVDDVTNQARTKLRVMDGPRLLLAALGHHVDRTGIAQMLGEPLFKTYLQGLWSAEVQPTVQFPENEFLGAFCDSVLERLSSPLFPQPLHEILTDSSYKLPDWVFGTVQDNLDEGRDISHLALGIAAWLRLFLNPEQKAIADPLAGPIQSIGRALPKPSGWLSGALAIKRLFPESLAKSHRFREALLDAIALLDGRGVTEAIASLARTRTGTV